MSVIHKKPNIPLHTKTTKVLLLNHRTKYVAGNELEVITQLMNHFKGEDIFSPEHLKISATADGGPRSGSAHA